MKLLRITYKLIILCSLAVIAMVVTLFYSLGHNNSEGSSKVKINPKQMAYRKKWLQMVVKAIGLDLQVKGNVSTSLDGDKQSALWVANHISWMDIAVIGSQGVGFLSKSEVRKWPVIGWLGSKSGTVFINRGGKNASQTAAKAIAEKILEGDNILVFPEGTTTSGEDVKHFHARIFAPALDHQLLVQPIALQYLDEKGQLHPNASWSDENFFSNLFGVLAQPSIRAVLTFLPVIDVQQFTERRQLAKFAENQIKNVVLSAGV